MVLPTTPLSIPSSILLSNACSHLRLPAPRGRGWRHRPSDVGLPDGALDLTRDPPAQGACTTVPVLLETDWAGDEPIEQQRVVLDVRA